MDSHPNQDAAIFFASEILQSLRKARPGIKAVFVGRNPSKQITDLGRIDGITITGTVDDVVIMYFGRIVIVPLRIGGGSRLKILEAMAMREAGSLYDRGGRGIGSYRQEEYPACGWS